MVIVLLSVAVLAGACSEITDNVEVDVGGIATAACNSLGDSFAAGIVRQMEQISADPTFPIPEVDVAGLLDKATGLGCSPEGLRELIETKVEDAGIDTAKAKEFLDEVLEQVGDE